MNLPMEHGASSEDFVVVEDASDEDEAEIDTNKTIEDPIVAGHHRSRWIHSFY